MPVNEEIDYHIKFLKIQLYYIRKTLDYGKLERKMMETSINQEKPK